MILRFWRWLHLWLPYGLIIWFHRHNKALPTNIRTREGNNYKAIMITADYGIIFSDKKYIQNRGRYLMQQKRMIEERNNEVISELNALNVLAREDIYRESQEDNGGI